MRAAQAVYIASSRAGDVLLALAADPTRWRYGYDLATEVSLKSGSLYPILVRLADRDLLETTWETDVPAGRPPRPLYRLTGSGRALATELAATTTAATATRRSRPKERWQGA